MLYKETLDRLNAPESAVVFSSSNDDKAHLVKADAGGPINEAEELGLNPTGYALYGLVREAKPLTVSDSVKPLADDPRVALASMLEETLRPHVAIVDWVSREDVQKDMRRLVKRQLSAAEVASERRDALAEQIVDLMKRRRER